jgi:hypothetical protein
MSLIFTLVIIAAAIALGVALAYLPMRLLLIQMAKNVQQFIQRQTERRRAPRESPDRRKAPEKAPQP